jgi:hypothetical protein
MHLQIHYVRISTYIIPCFSLDVNLTCHRISADGVHWIEVAKNTEELDRQYVPAFRFDSVEARYVRLRIHMPDGTGLDGCVDIAELMVYNDGGNTFPENYEIQVSLDGVNFETVKTVTGDNVPFTQDNRVITLDGVPARFIRLYATRLTYHGSNGTGYGIAIAEMEVYGTKRTVAE